MGKLTARQAATLGPGKHNDGNGLWLAVSKTGAGNGFCVSPSTAGVERWA